MLLKQVSNNLYVLFQFAWLYHEVTVKGCEWKEYYYQMYKHILLPNSFVKIYKNIYNFSTIVISYK